MKSSVAATILIFATSIMAIPAKPPISIGSNAIHNVQLGIRPYYLISRMSPNSTARAALEKCAHDLTSFKSSAWSIGHRGGGTLQVPEHSLESAEAGARMGAGILECDVAFTKDLELVCRHSHCDLHTTTNIVTIPELNAKCQQPFTPANGSSPASAKCCTQDVTLAEFKSLTAKQDGFNASAATPKDFQYGTPRWRTDLFSPQASVLSLKEHIALVQSYGLKHTPELKKPDLGMPWGNFTQQAFAHKMLQTYRDAGVDPAIVYPQSFYYPDILYWLSNETEFQNLVFLDSNGETAIELLDTYAADRVPIIAPPLSYLSAAQDGKLVPSEYALRAKELGLKIVTWSLERSGFLSDGSHGGSYYQYAAEAVNEEGDALELLYMLHHELDVLGVFSDWVATTTFYANCFGL